MEGQELARRADRGSRKGKLLEAAGRFSLCAQTEAPPYKYVTVEGPIVAVEPTDEERLQHDRIVSVSHEVSYGAFRSDPDSVAGLMARSGLRHLYGEEPILIRTLGGSIPIAPIIAALDVPAAIVPTVNIDNNQHSPNENLRLGNFVEGIAMLMSVLSQAP